MVNPVLRALPFKHSNRQRSIKNPFLSMYPFNGHLIIIPDAVINNGASNEAAVAPTRAQDST